MSTLYASFPTPEDAERVVGALLDNGAEAADISILANKRTAAGDPIPEAAEAADAEHSAKSGLSTTTSFDVAAGTVKGATVGIGIGALATLAALFIPGVGLVLGGGALAAAVMGGTGTIIAGAAAGGLTGYLKDQGVPDDIVTHYSNTFLEGGSIVAIAVPSGSLAPETAEGIFTKYGAANIATVNNARTLVAGTELPAPEALVVQDENSAIAPAAFVPAATVVAAPVAQQVYTNDPLAVSTPEVVSATPVFSNDPLQAVTPTHAVTPMTNGVVDDPQPTPYIDVVDPVTGAVTKRPIDTTIYTEDQQVTTLQPNQEVVKDAVGGLHQTVGHPTVISEQQVVVTDPETGERRAGKVVEEQHAVARDSVATDPEGHLVEPIDGPEETVVVREKHIELL